MSTTDIVQQTPVSTGFSTAEVLECDESGQYVRVSTTANWDTPSCWARLATGPLRPVVGDQVLVAGGNSDDMYVIGCLSPPSSARLTTEHGTYAECKTNSDGHETVCVMTKENELLFEHDPHKGVTRVAVPEGSLELATKQGDLVLSSAGNVRITGGAVDVRARHRLTLGVIDTLGRAKSWFRMLQDRLQAGGTNLELEVENTEVHSHSTRVSSNEISVEAKRLTVTAEQLESTAETRIEQSGSVYQTVVDLLQQQTGRLRTYVSGLSHFHSKRAYFSSEETFNIDGDKVNLG